MNESFFKAFTELKNVPGSFNSVLYVNRNGLEVCYTPKEEIERVKEQGAIFFDSNFRDQFRRDIKKCAESFEKFYTEFSAMRLADIEMKKLLDLFNTYVSCLIPMLAHYQVSGGRTFPLLEQRIKEAMSRYFFNADL
ncbi:MAG TPA: hypothetical protein VJH94_02040 [Candidatus Paceibacterota bacterium]